MEKETVFIILLLKPMTKISQVNDIATMMYHGGFPVLKNINLSARINCRFLGEIM